MNRQQAQAIVTEQCTDHAHYLDLYFEVADKLRSAVPQGGTEDLQRAENQCRRYLNIMNALGAVMRAI